MRKLAARGVGARRRRKPNILFIISDDQPKRRTWNSTVMPNAFARFVDGGMEYDNSFASSAWCGPTRATYMTGRYEHTHGVEEFGTNPYEDMRGNGGAGGNWGLLGDTTATRLDAAGYRCGIIGKIQNGYYLYPNEIPPGYDSSAWFVWASLHTQDPPFTFNEYGTVVNWSSGITNTSNRITQETVDFINDHQGRSDPFFLSVGYLDPHFPYTPAAEDASIFNGVALEDVPSMASMSAGERTAQRVVQEGKMEETHGVDRGVGAIFDALEATGQLANTYVFYNADSGYLLGEHDEYEKGRPWREVTEVPLCVVGPGITPGSSCSAFASQIDVMPTFLGIAGLSWSDLDGRSLVPTFDGSTPSGWRQRVLIEDGKSQWRMIRTDRYSYIQEYGSGGTNRLFDLGEAAVDSDAMDTWEMTNLYSAAEGISVRTGLQAQLDALRVCSGSGCRSAEV